MKLIAAISKNNCIGKDGKLPWKFPEDMRFFKETTIENCVVMGYNTWVSLGKKVLPNRDNIIIDAKIHEVDLQGYGNYYSAIVPDYNDVISECQYYPETHRMMYVIGGAKTYQKFLDLGVIDELIITHINIEVDGDTFFSIPDGWKVYKEKVLSENCVVKYYKKD